MIIIIFIIIIIVILYSVHCETSPATTVLKVYVCQSDIKI